MPTIVELKEIAKGRGLTGYSKMTKAELLTLIGEQDDKNQVIIKGSSDVVNVFVHDELSFQYRDKEFKQISVKNSKLFGNDKGEMMMIQKFTEGKGIGKAGSKGRFELYQLNPIRIYY